MALTIGVAHNRAHALSPTDQSSILARRATARFCQRWQSLRNVRASAFRPLRVQKALYPEGDDVCQAILLHPLSGIVGGDHLEITARVGPSAHAQLITPGAGEWYHPFAGRYRRPGRLRQNGADVGALPGASRQDQHGCRHQRHLHRRGCQIPGPACRARSNPDHRPPAARLPGRRADSRRVRRRPSRPSFPTSRSTSSTSRPARKSRARAAPASRSRTY